MNRAIVINTLLPSHSSRVRVLQDSHSHTALCDLGDSLVAERHAPLAARVVAAGAIFALSVTAGLMTIWVETKLVGTRAPTSS